MVSGVGRGMSVLDGVVIVEVEWAVLGVNWGHPIVTNGTLRRGSSKITLSSTCLTSLSIFKSHAFSEYEFVNMPVKHNIKLYPVRQADRAG